MDYTQKRFPYVDPLDLKYSIDSESGRLAGARIYFKSYPRIFNGISFWLLTLVISLILVILAFAEGTSKDILESLSVLFAFVAAYFLGQEFTVDLFLERSGQISAATGKIDYKKGPFQPNNHSSAAIAWSPALSRAESNLVRHIYIEDAPRRCQGLFPIVEKLQETTTTRSYRVISFFGAPIMIRTTKEPKSGDIERRELVTNELLDQSCGNRPFSAAAISKTKPQKCKDGETAKWISGSLVSPNHKLLVQLFPYADCSRHFGGTRAELRSFAIALGRLQSALNRIDEEKKNEITETAKYGTVIRNRWKSKESIQRFGEEFEEVVQAFKNRREKKSDTRDQILSQSGFEKTEIRDTLERASACIQWAQDKEVIPNTFAMHDVHPHNTFFCKGRCALIYDYSWVDFWPHEVVVAFALHRFIRAVIRREQDAMILPSKGNPEAVRAAALDLAKSFLTDYEVGYGASCFNIDEFLDNLSSLIEIANVTKLNGSSRRALELTPDPQRDETYNWSEVRKFFNIFNESKYFGRESLDGYEPCGE